MPENRYFIDQNLFKNQTLQIPKNELKHLQVMRKKTGDFIEIVNGRNQLAQATLVSSEMASIDSVETAPPPSIEIVLALGFLRPKNLYWVIEKGTELGASSFWLFPTKKSEKKALTKTQHTRLQNLIISAVKQCGRLDLPSICFPPPLSKWKKPSIPLFYGDLGSKKRLTKCDSAIVAIGPESGFTKEELNILKALGGTPISLSSFTLRAETAAICALSKIL